MLKTKVLPTINKEPKELAEILKPVNRTGVYFTGTVNHSEIARTFCSCGYESAKSLNFGEKICPECQGELLYKERFCESSSVVKLRKDRNKIIAERYQFTLNQDLVLNQVVLSLKIELVWTLELDEMCYPSNPKKFNWELDPSTASNTRDFEIFDKSLIYGSTAIIPLFKESRQLKHIISDAINLGILLEGFINYPKLFSLENISQKTTLFENIISVFKHNGFNTPSIPFFCDHSFDLWKPNTPLQKDVTLENVYYYFGVPASLIPYCKNLETIYTTENVFMDPRNIEKFCQTPFGKVLLNRLFAEIITYQDFIDWVLWDMAVQKCNGQSIRYENNYLSATSSQFKKILSGDSSEIFNYLSVEETNLFLNGFLRDYLDISVNLRETLKVFGERILFYRKKGVCPTEENIRTKAFNSFKNYEKYKTLKNTDVVELIQEDPLTAISRLRGLAPNKD